MNNKFIEVDHYQKYKRKQVVSGDSFLSKKIKEQDRVISVLSDGLGSGIKASVLSILTSTMGLNYSSNDFDIEKTARKIMKTLPVCEKRKISYSTFSIVDINQEEEINIAEYDNPNFILVRNGKVINPEPEEIELNSHEYKQDILKLYNFKAQLGDRIILFTDGVTQSGMGTDRFPLGWGKEEVEDYVYEQIEEKGNSSARELARAIVSKAYEFDHYEAKDDITCGVINIRKPRKLLIASGPPLDKDKDPELARIVEDYQGKKIICGGTTAKIISRELDRELQVEIDKNGQEVPPHAQMEGIDMITEGILTLGKFSQRLKNRENTIRDEVLKELKEKLLNSDIIHFVVGTRINEAHQDPNIPDELGIRRNVIKEIAETLENEYLKETNIEYI